MNSIIDMDFFLLKEKKGLHNGQSSGCVQGMGNGSNVTPLHGGVGATGNANYDESIRSNDYFTGGGNIWDEPESLSGCQGSSGNDASLICVFA